MMEKFKGLVVEEEGQGMAEYGLILGLVAVAAVGALTALGGGISEQLNDIVGKLGGGESTEG